MADLAAQTRLAHLVGANEKHRQLLAYHQAALLVMAASGELAVLNGTAYAHQLGLLQRAAYVLLEAFTLMATDIDLEGWRDVLEEAGRDLDQFKGALVKPPQVEPPDGR
jgi:DNA-binding PucR family transcriptional regulator